MMPNAIISSWMARGVTAIVSSVIAVISGRPSRQSRGFYKQHQHHQDKYHGVGGFGIKVFGQSLDHAKRKAGDDRSQDGPHAADYHHGEHDDDQIGAHQRPHLVDTRRP